MIAEEFKSTLEKQLVTTKEDIIKTKSEIIFLNKKIKRLIREEAGIIELLTGKRKKIRRSKKELEADIQKDFDAALIGIRKLPQGVRLGVYAAYSLYLKLFNKIKKTPALQLVEKRIRISSVGKSLVLLGSFYRNSGR